MTNQDTAQRTLADAAADAMNSGLAAGRVSAHEAASALLSAFAHSPDLAARGKALARELAGVAAGTSTITAVRGDSRFADAAWQQNPVYRRIGQAYLAAAKAVTTAVDTAPLDWRRPEQAGSPPASSFRAGADQHLAGQSCRLQAGPRHGRPEPPSRRPQRNSPTPGRASARRVRSPGGHFQLGQNTAPHPVRWCSGRGPRDHRVRADDAADPCCPC
jgi:hypothetical protein